MSIESLAAELLLHIAGELAPKELNALIQTRRAIANLLTPVLYREVRLKNAQLQAFQEKVPDEHYKLVYE